MEEQESNLQLDLPTGCFGVQPNSIRNACGAGIDIRPGSWDITIAEVVYSPMGINVVRPVFIGKVRDEIDALFLLRQYHVKCAVADTRPETTLAKRLQVSAKKYAINVWRAEYNTSHSAIPISTNEAEGVLKIDRTMILDEVHYAFHTGLAVIIPQNFKEVTGGSFAREMCSSTRVPTKWLGRDCYTWQHQGPDHSFHAFGYLLAAIKKGNLISYGGSEMHMVRGAVQSMSVKTTDGKVKVGIDWEKEEAKEETEFFEA